jgi:opacity protein-like surface antigen
MKKVFTALAILFLSGSVMAQETTNKTDSKFEFAVIGKLGFAQLKQSGIPSLNGNLTGSDFLWAYKISPKWELAVGVGYYEFHSNTIIAGDAASLKNSFLRSPLQLNHNYSLLKSDSTNNDRIFLTIGLGVYANTILKQEIEALAGNTESSNLGWNFGLTTQVGAKFIVNDAINIAVGLEYQSDMTKAEKNGTEQKLEQFNAVYFGLGFKF